MGDITLIRGEPFLGHLAPEQRLAVARLAERLDADTTSVLKLLVDAALYVTGLDPAGHVAADELLDAAVADDERDVIADVLHNLAAEAHVAASNRRAAERG